MDTLSRDDFRTLARRNRGPRVSIYAPTSRGGTSESDFLLFRNLVKAAENDLIEAGMRTTEATRMMEPVHRIAEDHTFWHMSADGLAVFVAEHEMTTLRTPISFRPLELVSGRCHMKPLLPLLDEEGRFFLLALSRNRCRLFEGDLMSLDEVTSVRLPEGILDALRYDDIEKQERFHVGAVSSAGGRSVQHGQGIGAEVTKERLHRYCHEVDRALRRTLAKGSTPMVLAGVEYELAIFRSENTYPHLLSSDVLGNPDHLSADALHAKAWPIVEEELRRGVAIERERLLAGSGRGLLVTDLTEILGASFNGGVEVLFVASETEVWGRYDAATGDMSVRERPEPGDEDLLDLAAVQTVLGGGKAHATPIAEIPGGGGAAALLRHR